MNKHHSYLTFWFFVVFVIQGFRMKYETISFKQLLEREHSKYEEITEENINKLIELANQTENFPKINRIEFIFFFHGACFDVEKARDIIVSHYKLRKHIFGEDEKDPDICELEETKTVISYSILHSDSVQPMNTGYRYVYTHLIDTIPEHYDIIKSARYYFYMMKCLLIEYGTSDGVVLIMNAKGFTKAHVFKLIRSKLFLILLGFTQVLPLQLKKIYVLNTNKWVTLAFTAARAWTSGVVFCAPDSTTVYDGIDGVPKTIMPKDSYKDGLGPKYEDQASKTYELMKKLHSKYGP